MKKFLSMLFIIVLVLLTIVSCNLKSECAHENTEVLPAKDATCSEEGLTEGTKCLDCEEIIVAQEPIEKLAHTISVGNAVAATCSTEGRTAEEKCTVCQEIVVASTVVPKLPHTEVVMDSFPATCIEAGSEGGKYCSVCFEDIEAPTVIPAKGHTEVTLDAVAPDCVNTGLTEGVKCDDCGEILVAQKEVEALGHSEREIPAVAPTCASVGYTAGVDCSVCSEVLEAPTEIEIDADAHPTDNVTLHTAKLESTCAAVGHEDIFACSACNTTFGGAEIAINAEAHPEGSKRVLAAVDPTCHSLGYEEGLHCDACNTDIIAQIEIPMTPHAEYEFAAAIAPDCGTGTVGYTAHIKCYNCDYEVAPVEVPFAHEYSEWETVIEATESTAGEKHCVCGICGDIKTEEIPALGDGRTPDIDDDAFVPVN